jgi:putative nucleotidyltransferase with HDIG domain
VVSDFFTIKTAYNYINSKIKTDRPNDYDFLLPLLENALTYNVVFDEATTQKDARQALESIATSRGLVREGELIIIKGEVVDQIKFKKLESLQFEFKNKAYSYSSKWWLMLGNFILVGAAISMFIIFLALFRKDIYADNKRVLFLLLMIILMCYLFLFARKLNIIDMYLVPVCILPIIVRAFYDTRTALFTHIVTLLIIGFEAPAGFEFMYIQTIAGMVAIFTIVSFSNRSQFFITVLLIFLTYAITFIGVTIVQEANLRNIDWMNLKWFLGNAVITLFAFPLIFVFEKLFGFLSDVTLLELADSNAPLLRELALKAPGTFQHSLQVANLAEAAVTRIGGNPLLVRTGALYHDIGKMEMPVYFIENQLTQVNPHDELSFEESAAIIKSHVTRGIERARKANIPEQIIDFIRTHHGNTRLQYFYQSFIKNFPDEIPDEEDFRYPGPLPFNKETAVLMMADSVEAASRSLNEATSEHIDLLVERIIAKQIEDDQFINSPLTLKDISEVKRIFKKMLYSIYHVRIAYPH